MENIFFNSGLALIEGIGLIASPCILPILPIFLSASISGSRKRPLGIIFGFVITFALFTYFSRKLVQYSGIDLNIIRHISFFLLALLGIVMISTYLSDKFSRLTRSLGNVGAKSARINNNEGGFFSGVLFGALIAFVWTPCAGPILAAVIVQTVLQKTNIGSFLILISFAIGAAIPMLLIAIYGRFLMAKLSIFKTHSGLFRKILGVIILLSVGLMVYQDSLSSTNTFTISSTDQSTSQTALINGIKPYPAPPIVGATGWINSEPLTISSLKGKVVLIDFWTYSCINCVRTLPYVTGWYAKYHSKGLDIIGVHSPEFEFEKDKASVVKATEKYGIKYPVVLDSDYGTWQSYNNKYWPAQYLIDKNGMVVYQHFGEGEDDVMENNIRFLLGITKVTDDTPSGIDIPDMTASQTPETYLGTARAAHYSSPETITAGVESFTFPSVLASDAWALQGKWTVMDSYIRSEAAGAAIKIHFHAKHVYVVMGNTSGDPIKVKAALNGEAVVNNKGADVTDSSVIVNGHQLYTVLSFNSSQDGILTLTASAPGLDIYTFTFG